MAPFKQYQITISESGARQLLASALLISALGASGCASPSLRVESQPPGAEITVAALGQPARKVGVTPLELNEFAGPNSPAIHVTASLKGRETQSAFVPSSKFSQKGSLFFQLDETSLPPACENFKLSLQKIALGVAQVQTQIAGRRLDQAISSLNLLIAEFSDVSVLHDLLGNVHYLRKDLDAALASYRRSLALNSSNPDTERMIKKIQSLRGTAP